MFRIDLLRIAILLVVGCSGWSFAQAEESFPADKTILEIQVLTPPIAGSVLDAQRWREIFKESGVSVRFRQPLLSDKMEITESTRGTFRIVKLVGELDRRGMMHFPGHEFTLQNPGLLKDWLGELRQFGAQGSPKGKPLWGLTEVQFEELTKSLSARVQTSTLGLDFDAALAAIPLGPGHKLVIHSSAQEILPAESEAPLKIDVAGLSTGTALAAVLSQWQMGFQPLRTPGGRVDLLVQPLDQIDRAWSIGWDVDPITPRDQIVPILFEMVETGFDAVPLTDVLQAISTRTGVPIVLDHAQCRARGIDPGALAVSYPYKKSAWILVVRSVVRTHRMNYKLRLDEAGTPFLYVAPFVPVPAAGAK